MNIPIIAFSILFAWTSTQAPANFDLSQSRQISRQIEVMIDQIPVQQGELYVFLYNNSEEGLAKTVTPLMSTTATSENGRAKVKFENVPEGQYGVMVFLDRNENGILDRNWAGKPLESYGYSGLMESYIGIPLFSDISFNLKDRDQVVLVRMNKVNKKLPPLNPEVSEGISSK